MAVKIKSAIFPKSAQTNMHCNNIYWISTAYIFVIIWKVSVKVFFCEVFQIPKYPYMPTTVCMQGIISP